MTLRNRYILTYHKCGSNWFRNIFGKIAELRGMNWRVTPYSAAKVNEPVDRASAETITIIRGGGEDALLEAGYERGQPCVRCIRDPRDALISQYWSWKNSHHNNTPEILEGREVFANATQKDSLLWLIDRRKLMMERQVSNLDRAIYPDIVDIRYERLLENFADGLAPALDHLRLELSADEVEEIRVACSFEKKTRRKPGEIDTSHHLRRGQAGEWREVFDDDIKAAFKAAYGQFVVDLGYAPDERW